MQNTERVNRDLICLKLMYPHLRLKIEVLPSAIGSS